MSFGKLILLAIIIGIITMVLGALIMKVGGRPDIRTLLPYLFVIGLVLFVVLEFTGAHKAFCASY